jgi:hypothetical protein
MLRRAYAIEFYFAIPIIRSHCPYLLKGLRFVRCSGSSHHDRLDLSNNWDALTNPSDPEKKDRGGLRVFQTNKVV